MATKKGAGTNMGAGSSSPWPLKFAFMGKIVHEIVTPRILDTL
jgi:hypothetical protein